MLNLSLDEQTDVYTSSQESWLLMEDHLKIRGISQHPMIGSYSDSKLMLRGPNQSLQIL